jgi:hypothetical protein
LPTSAPAPAASNGRADENVRPAGTRRSPRSHDDLLSPGPVHLTRSAIKRFGQGTSRGLSGMAAPRPGSAPPRPGRRAITPTRGRCQPPRNRARGRTGAADTRPARGLAELAPLPPEPACPEMGNLRALPAPVGSVLSHSDSAGRVWIVLPALLSRIWLGAGVGSGAWVRPDLRFG